MDVDIKILNRVHREQLARFLYVPDKTQFDIEEYWMPDDEIPAPPHILQGDCDDAAIACRKQLREEYGIKSRLILCKTETKEYHLVCSVEGFILDNRQRTVWNQKYIPYEWIKASGFERGDPWHLIMSSKGGDANGE